MIWNHTQQWSYLAAKHYRRLASTKLLLSLTEAHAYQLRRTFPESLFVWQWKSRESNPLSVDCESDALTTTPPSQAQGEITVFIDISIYVVCWSRNWSGKIVLKSSLYVIVLTVTSECTDTAEKAVLSNTVRRAFVVVSVNIIYGAERCQSSQVKKHANF